MSIRDAVRKSFGIQTQVVPIEQQQMPMGWSAAQFPPGEPIRPTDQPWEEGVPREIDFNISANTTIQPRTNYGLNPFSLLRETYDIITEVKLVVHTLIGEASVLLPQLTSPSGDILPIDHPANQLITKPDGTLEWSVWLARFYRNLLMFDAPSIYFDYNNNALRVVQGDTVFPIIDQHGRRPDSPAPAFAQIIKGVVMQWFTKDELWYSPMSIRDNAPFGEPFIEIAWSHILFAAQVIGFELAHYKQGNMPEGWLIPPEDMSPSQVIAFERSYNQRMMSGPDERNRVRILPGKWTFTQAKRTEFPAIAYQKALDIIGLSAGIAPAQWQMIKSGLGGKGAADVMSNQTYRTGTSPVQRLTNEAINTFLREMYPDGSVKFNLIMPTQGMDPTAQATQTLQNFSNGLATLNEARTALGLKPITGGDVLVVIRNGQIVSMSDFLNAGGHTLPVANATQAASQEQEMNSTIDSNGPSTKSDTDLARRIVENGSTNPGVTISTPSTSSPARLSDIGSSTSKAMIRKITGVDDSDDEYFGAPVDYQSSLDVPFGGHANNVQVLAITPKGLPPRPGIWKPYSGENPKLIKRIGHPQFVSEEAAYLLDRTMQFYLVPVAYIAKVEGEWGSISYFVEGSKPGVDPQQYSDFYAERAATLDYIMGNLDRRIGDGKHANWLTHPTDPKRPILIDNGLCFPDTNAPLYSPFIEYLANRKLGPEVMNRVKRARFDHSLWHDITALVGEQSTQWAQYRMDKIIQTGTLEVSISSSESSPSSGETTLSLTPVGNGN
jgi:hypothetical protein